ncbi:MAG: DUF4235 domain-containing protein [Solirubrobacteraceae bacterium]
MRKLAFLPLSVGSGLIAGAIARKAFEALWGTLDDQEPPKPEHRDVRLVKLIAAVTLEGAVFSITRGLVDHGARRAFERATGQWPGEERPEDE